MGNDMNHPEIKNLIQDGAEAGQLMEPGPARDLITRLAHTLSDVHDVAVGADHTAAKYWRRMTEAERERDEAREARVQEREESNVTYQQRDELAAVIERAKAEAIITHRALTGREPSKGDESAVIRVLNSVPADVLRERDAEAGARALREAADCVEQVDGRKDDAVARWLRARAEVIETKEQD